MVNVELVYCPVEAPTVHLRLRVEVGASIADVIAQSGLVQRYPEIAKMSVGIFAKTVPLDTVVREGNRAEIYRPLLIDPKENRRQRAREKKG